MKPSSSAPEEARLSALLRSWQVPAEPPPRFADAVWRRIANEESATAASSAPVSPFSWLIGWLGRPRVAWLYVLTLFALGAGAGMVRGNAQASRLADGLQGRYVASIDPFAARH